MQRSRAVYFLFVAGTVVLGLLSRRYREQLPEFIGTYAGDALWAAMVFFLAATIWNRASTGALALGALLFSFAIEFSQLYQASWINDLRATRLGGLVLGYGFLPSDLLCYSAGVAASAAIDHWNTRRKRS